MTAPETSVWIRYDLTTTFLPWFCGDEPFVKDVLCLHFVPVDYMIMTVTVKKLVLTVLVLRHLYKVKTW